MANLTPNGGKPDEHIECSHENSFLKVLDVVVTCETTAEYCPDCKQFLTEPITDC
jgi:hypothetical protein